MLNWYCVTVPGEIDDGQFVAANDEHEAISVLFDLLLDDEPYREGSGLLVFAAYGVVRAVATLVTDATAVARLDGAQELPLVIEED